MQFKNEIWLMYAFPRKNTYSVTPPRCQSYMIPPPSGVEYLICKYLFMYTKLRIVTLENEILKKKHFYRKKTFLSKIGLCRTRNLICAKSREKFNELDHPQVKKTQQKRVFRNGKLKQSLKILLQRFLERNVM